MTPQQLKLLEDVVYRLGKLELADRYRFNKNIEIADGKNIQLTGTILGTKIATDPKQKLGFYGNTPVVQNASPNGKQTTSGSSAITMTTGHAFNGNTGSTYYTVGDVVYALKVLGFIAN